MDFTCVKSKETKQKQRKQKQTHWILTAVMKVPKKGDHSVESSSNCYGGHGVVIHL